MVSHSLGLIWDALHDVNNEQITAVFSVALWLAQKKSFSWIKQFDNNINKEIVLGRISKETGMYRFKSDSYRKVD